MKKVSAFVPHDSLMTLKGGALCQKQRNDDYSRWFHIAQGESLCWLQMFPGSWKVYFLSDPIIFTDGFTQGIYHSAYSEKWESTLYVAHLTDNGMEADLKMAWLSCI